MYFKPNNDSSNYNRCKASDVEAAYLLAKTRDGWVIVVVVVVGNESTLLHYYKKT